MYFSPLLRLIVISSFALPCALAQVRTDESLTPLMKASAQGDLKEVNRLLSRAADVHSRTRDGQTALYEAIEWRHPNRDSLPVVGALLRSGADPNETEIFGMSALSVSLTRDHNNPNVTLLLLQAGAKVPTVCPKSDSIVSLATQDSSVEVMSALIAKGAPVSCQDERGQTALHWASLNGQADRVALLLKSGANIGLKNSEGKTPLDVAVSANLDPRVQAAFASTRAELIAASAH